MLFTPFQMGPLLLRNRMVMAPMTRNRAEGPGAVPNDQMALYYAQRASAGLIVSEGVAISPMALGSPRVPGIYTEGQITGWAKVTQAVHQEGGAIFAQLWHVGRLSHPNLLGGRLPLAPSAIDPRFKTYTDKGFTETVAPKAMSLDEVAATISDFVTAARNAMAAGFDGIELHAANGYLFHQFFALCSNTRTDAYGGTIGNRSRFLFDVLDGVTAALGPGKVGVRLSPTLQNTFGIVKDAETEALFDAVAERLNDYPLAYLHLSGFTLDQEADPMARVMDSAARFRKLYKGTLIANKGFDKASAEKALLSGVADLISFGIPFIANPDLVERFKRDLPLAAADRKTFYSAGTQGYNDYPAWA